MFHRMLIKFLRFEVVLCSLCTVYIRGNKLGLSFVGQMSVQA